MRTAFHLNLWGSYMGIKRGIDGIADHTALTLQSKVLQQHSGRENLRQRIGQVLTCCLGPRAVNRLKERRMLT